MSAGEPMAAPVPAPETRAWRCLNCKTIVFEDAEPKRCPACRWGTNFAPCGEVTRPPRGQA